MLGKLLKQEFKATTRTFLPVYAALLILSVINRIFFLSIGFERWDISTLPQPLRFLVTTIPALSSVFYGLLIAAIFILVPVVAIERFARRLLGDEGYLMFTLPVEPWKHVVTRGTVSVVWMCASLVTVILSACVMAVPFNELLTIPRGFFTFFSEYFREIGAFNGILYLIEFAVFMFLCLYAFIFMIYTSIAIGHQCKRHKLLGAFGAYIVICIIVQIIVTVSFYFVFNITNSISFEITEAMALSIMHLIALLSILFTGLMCAAFLWSTQRILTKNVNLA